jgi:hypothetical protein
MFERNLKIPFTFVAVSDQEEEKFPPGKQGAVWIKPARKCWGWWNLQEAYSNPWWAGNDQVLYTGLDTVITGDITEQIKERIAANKLTLIRDFSYLVDGGSEMFKNTWADGIAFIPKGGIPILWNRFFNELGEDSQYPMHIWNTAVMKEFGIVPDLFDDVSPGLHCSYKWPHEKLELPPEPVVCFHGVPNPSDVVDRVDWVKEHWR